jgi:hypothetical protein
MVIPLTSDKAIHQLQLEFNRRYPFLRLEFSKPGNSDPNEAAGELSPFTLLKNAGLSKEGEWIIEDSMSVKQLEKTFQLDFGLVAHVSRRSGLLWIQTTLTNNWTLKKQNEHGQEISLAINPYPGKAAGK